jgi:hypothetical protein
MRSTVSLMLHTFRPLKLRRSLPNLDAPKHAAPLLQKTKGALTEVYTIHALHIQTSCASAYCTLQCIFAAFADSRSLHMCITCCVDLLAFNSKLASNRSNLNYIASLPLSLCAGVAP